MSENSRFNKQCQRRCCDDTGAEFSLIRQATMTGSQGLISLREEIHAKSYAASSDMLANSDSVPTEHHEQLQARVRLKKPQSDPCSLTLLGHKNEVTGMCILCDYIITCSLDATVRFWRRDDGCLVKKLDSNKPVYSLAHVRIEMNKYILLVGGKMGEVEIHRGTIGKIIDMKLVGRYPFHAPNPVTTLKVSPDRLQVFTATCYPIFALEHKRLIYTARGSMKLWNLSDILDFIKDDFTGTDGQPTAQIMRTVRQILHSASLMLRKHNSIIDNRIEDFGVKSAEYTPDSSMVIIGLGLPNDSTKMYSKTLVLCCADTLRVLYVFGGMAAQINHLVATQVVQIASTSALEISEITCLFAQTPLNIMKLRIVRKRKSWWSMFSKLLSVKVWSLVSLHVLNNLNFFFWWVNLQQYWN